MISGKMSTIAINNEPLREKSFGIGCFRAHGQKLARGCSCSQEMYESLENPSWGFPTRSDINRTVKA